MDNGHIFKKFKTIIGNPIDNMNYSKEEDTLNITIIQANYYYTDTVIYSYILPNKR